MCSEFIKSYCPKLRQLSTLMVSGRYTQKKIENNKTSDIKLEKKQKRKRTEILSKLIMFKWLNTRFHSWLYSVLIDPEPLLLPGLFLQVSNRLESRVKFLWWIQQMHRDVNLECGYINFFLKYLTFIFLFVQSVSHPFCQRSPDLQTISKKLKKLNKTYLKTFRR